MDDGLRATLKSYIHSFADSRITDARISVAVSRARRQVGPDQDHAFVGQGGDFECVLCGLPDDHTIHYRDTAGPVD